MPDSSEARSVVGLRREIKAMDKLMLAPMARDINKIENTIVICDWANKKSIIPDRYTRASLMARARCFLNLWHNMGIVKVAGMAVS